MGRSTTNLQIRISMDTHADLQALASRRGQTVAEIVRQAIAKEIGNAAIADAAEAIRPMLKSIVAKEIADTQALAFRAVYAATLAAEFARDQIGRYAKSAEDYNLRIGHAQARTIMRLRKPFSIGKEEAAVDEYLAQYGEDSDATV